MSEPLSASGDGLTLGDRARYGAEAAVFFAFMAFFRVIGLSAASRLGGFIVWLGLVCLAAGMAGPRWGRDWSQSAAPGRDVSPPPKDIQVGEPLEVVAPR